MGRTTPRFYSGAIRPPSFDLISFGDPAHAHVVRATVTLVWVLIAAITPLDRYAAFDFRLFSGFGIGRLILTLPGVDAVVQSHTALQAIRICLIAAGVVALLSEKWARAAGIATLLCALLLDSITKGLGGFANHQRTVPLLALALVTFGIEASKPIDRRATNARESADRGVFVVNAVALTIVLPYTFIGLQRLIDGGLGLLMGPAILEYLAASTKGFATYPEWFHAPTFAPLLKIGFAATTVLEATSILVLYSPSYRRVWLLAMGGFHVMTIGLMNIFFWENLILAVATLWPGSVLPSLVRDRTAGGRASDSDLDNGEPSSFSPMACSTTFRAVVKKS